MSSKNTRTNESGAVVSFIVIGVILAAIVVGGIYVVQKRGENAPATSPVASPSTTATPESSPPAVSSPTPSPSKSPQPATGVPLPSTGPSDDLLGAVGFAILLGVIIAYLRSYKFRFGSLRG